DCAAGHARPSQSAGDLLAAALARSSGRITLIATGPVTNVAVAFQNLRRYGLPPQLTVRAAYIGGGRFNLPPDNSLLPPESDGPQRIIAGGDPAAKELVLRPLSPLQAYLVADDATNDVPVRLDYLDLLTANARTPAATPAAAYVVRLMNDPLIRGAVAAG